MNETIQKLETVTNTLKIRLFDAQEKIDFIESQMKEREKVLMTIVQMVGVQPDHNGEVSFEAIIDAVRALVPVEKPEDEQAGFVEDAQV